MLISLNDAFFLCLKHNWIKTHTQSVLALPWFVYSLIQQIFLECHLLSRVCLGVAHSSMFSPEDKAKRLACVFSLGAEYTDSLLNSALVDTGSPSIEEGLSL